MIIKAVFLVGLFLFFPGLGLGKQPAVPLRLLEMIELPGVVGRIDHLAIDTEGQRLFIAALGNNSIEVVDLRHGFKTGSIGGLSEPQGIFYDSQQRKIYVSNGGDGNIRIYEADTFHPTGVVSFSSDADNMHVDDKTGYLYVGYGGGGLGMLDVRNQKKTGNVKLSGHPEGFAIEKNGTRIFVNIPTKNRVSVVDRTQGKEIADWPVTCRENFPMALDESQHRLFIGCRIPREVLVYDTDTGKKTVDLTVDQDVDDLFYDGSQKRLYVSCGAGSVYVFAQEDSDHYCEVAVVMTRAGARTSLFVPEMHRFYVAAPRNDGAPAKIMVYEVVGKEGD